MCDAQVGMGLAVRISRSQDCTVALVLWSLVRKRINHLDKLSCCLPWHAQDHTLIENVLGCSFYFSSFLRGCS